MPRKSIVFTLLLVVGLILATGQPGVTNAQGGTSEDTPAVQIEITGVVASINEDKLTLNDGTEFKINSGTRPISEDIVPGAAVTVIAEVDDDNLVAKSILLVTESTPEPTVQPTVEPKVEPTAEPTAQPTAEADCGGNNQQPVALRLSEAFGVPYAEIMGWHCQGLGFGEIARAYQLALLTAKSKSPLTAAAIFALRAGGKGWGQIIKESDVNPDELAPGKVIKLESKKPQDDKGQGNSDNGKGNGKDNGNGNDKNTGKDNGKGNGKGNGNGKKG